MTVMFVDDLNDPAAGLAEGTACVQSERDANLEGAAIPLTLEMCGARSLFALNKPNALLAAGVFDLRHSVETELESSRLCKLHGEPAVGGAVSRERDMAERHCRVCVLLSVDRDRPEDDVKRSWRRRQP